MLKTRIITTIIFLILFFLGLFSPYFFWVLPILLIIGVISSIHEFAHFRGMEPSPAYLFMADTAAIALILDAYVWQLDHALVIMGLLTIISLAYGTIRFDENFTASAGKCLIATLYCSLPLAMITDIWQKAIHADNQNGPHYILFIVIMTQAGDIGAYFAGRKFGKHKMAPKLSPGKTWEGFVGGVMFTIVLGALMHIFYNNIGRIFQFWEVMFLAVALTCIGAMGDLAESLLKRTSGVKDSGHTPTGMGGMLDIIDSLLFTIVFYYGYLWIMHPEIVRP